ncbi:hypothetical protein GTQ99_11650 [Kineococcus sp. T13]|uniref:hypothetical protein n=1 Tax=Kineococcus vitellinus TaxID=2696565 RepID=UPI001411D67D|nr:hypothetical protein [Kineococcus vitellinus]NAZ76060.1 hypothetical protein [Kineococcus vitellinus]
MVLDHSGYPLRRGEPEYTDDDRFWDGTRLHHLICDDVAKRQGVLLSTADVVVLNSMGCCPGTGHCGSKVIASNRARRRLAAAGFVRFQEPEGTLQHWEADDGTTLALLVGEVTRPCLD